jgi:hypothetical protein
MIKIEVMSETTKMVVGVALVGGLGYIAYSVYQSQHCDHGLDPNTKSCRKDPTAPYTQDELKKVGTDDGAAQTLLGAQGSDTKPIPPGKCGRKVDKNNKVGDALSWYWDDVGIAGASPFGIAKAVYDGFTVKCPKPPVDPATQQQQAQQLKDGLNKYFKTKGQKTPQNEQNNQAKATPQVQTKSWQDGGRPTNLPNILSSVNNQTALPVTQKPKETDDEWRARHVVGQPISPDNPKPRIAQGFTKDPRYRGTNNLLKDDTKR